MRLILASASPQRSQLLSGLGWKFEVIPSKLNESDHPVKDPKKRAIALARMKAEDIAKDHSNDCVIGCDTLVTAQDGTLFEKPVDEQDARRMLDLLSGGIAEVHSAVTVIAPTGTWEGLSTSRVTFTELSQEQKDWWISTKLWEGRSGGFQIDGAGQLMIENLEGDWTSVVGLPVFLVGELVKKSGWVAPGK